MGARKNVHAHLFPERLLRRLSRIMIYRPMCSSFYHLNNQATSGLFRDQVKLWKILKMSTPKKLLSLTRNGRLLQPVVLDKWSLMGRGRT